MPAKTVFKQQGNNADFADKHGFICINRRTLFPKHGEPPAHPHVRVSADRRIPPGETGAKDAVWQALGSPEAVSSLHTGWSPDQGQAMTAACLCTPAPDRDPFCPQQSAKQKRAFSLGITSNRKLGGRGPFTMRQALSPKDKTWVWRGLLSRERQMGRREHCE